MRKSFYIIVVLLALTLLGCCLFLFLPYAADRYLLPKLVKEMPFSQKSMSLSRVSPWRLRGTISFNERELPGIVVPKFEVHYLPGDLLRGRISTLLLESASLHFERREGRLFLRSLQKKEKREPGQKDISKIYLPGIVDKLVVKNSLLVVHDEGGGTLFLEINGRLEPKFGEDDMGRTFLQSVNGKIITRGALTSNVDLDIESGEGGYDALIKAELSNLNDLARRLLPEKMRYHGSTAVVETRLQSEGLKRLKSFEADILINQPLLEVGAVVLQQPAGAEEIKVRVDGSLELLQFSVSPLRLAAPEPSDIELKGEFALASRSFKADAKVLIERFSAPLTIAMEGKTSGGEITGEFSFGADTLRIGERITAQKLNGHGSVSVLQGVTSGELKTNLQNVMDHEAEVAAADISLSLPYEFPMSEETTSSGAKFTIGVISHKGEDIAALSAGMKLQGDSIIIDSSVTSPLHQDLKIICNGKADKKLNAEMQCNLKEVDLGSLSFPSSIKIPEKLGISGNINADARLKYRRGIFSGDTRINYSSGTVTYGDFTFSGIETSLHLPELPKLRSGPSQLAKVEQLEIGKIKMSDARIAFRLESINSIFIEGGQLGWCGGRVEIGGLRLQKDMEELNTTLYCDRLGYADLLNQLSVGEAEGEGSLNGRLPLSISSKGVRFDDGFLFSTPGTSGIVRFSNTDQLRQGMPTLDQAAYLEYSMASLENFSYNWTKLTFNTENEQLLLSLQLDGKPAEPLPFGYRQGVIVKTAQGQGLQHPIRLDVNFRLPLKELFRYGKNIQSIMENR